MPTRIVSWRGAALMAGAAACDPCPPLSETPIRGFEGAAYDIVAEGLRQAEAELAAPVCIDHVRLGGILSRNWGRYNPVTHGIRVARDAPVDDLDWILRHEICHGVDLQNDVVKRHEAVFDELADPEAGADWRARAEAMAELCAKGPAPFEPLWDQECPGDPDLRAERIIREEVYGLADPEPAAWFEPIAAHVVSEGPTSYDLIETVDGDLAILGGWFGGLVVVVDPFTGQPVDADDPSLVLTPLVVPEAPAGWYEDWDAGGPIDARTEVVRAIHAGSDALRLLVLTDGAWAPADAPCPDFTHTFFRFDGELWSAQLFGARLEWGRWHAGPRPAGP